EKNKSRGIAITAQRLSLLNRAEKRQPSFDIVDLVDSEGNPCGTKVVLIMGYSDLIEASQF
ncbi:MAG TPA: hypothetical protein VFV68_07980, partial [Agriterribacter sp.]|nr:hypothetical protein [Agriterribacter sp.]